MISFIGNTNTKNIIAFSGAKKPHALGQYKVIPIAKDPSLKDIDRAIVATNTNKAYSGLNGRAYFYGEDLVVKKYLGKNEAINYGPNREIKALDILYDNKIEDKNIQEGQFAFITPENETYLVSSKVKGKDIRANGFNEKNLKVLVDVLAQLDEPKKGKGQYFPYKVPMHYDLSPGNIVATDDSAGIIDFEYLEVEDLDEKLSRQKRKIYDCACDFSDIAGIPSNLRNFEYRTLLVYLKNPATKNPDKLFKDYLKIKSTYHKKRADFYLREALKTCSCDNKNLHELLEQLYIKETSHKLSLENPDENIVKAEAVKIQIASFIYEQSQFANNAATKINPEQIKKYVIDARDFFNEMLETSHGAKKEYYKDCVNLMKNWENVIPWMDWQEEQTKEFSELIFLSKEDADSYFAQNKDNIKNCKIFKSKLTKDNKVTLEELILK